MNHLSPWNVDDDGEPLGFRATEDLDHLGTGLDQLIDGVFNQDRFLQLMRNVTAFAQGADGLAKRIAKPHQYFAVNKALWRTVQAVESDGKTGVVWHTQGSGKSMEMELYTHYVQRHPKLLNPTIVVVTDRHRARRAALHVLWPPKLVSLLAEPGPLSESDIALTHRRLASAFPTA